MSRPSEAAQQHLEFLWPSIQARPDVQTAHELCASLDDKQLRRLLRDHRTTGINDDREMERREAVDYAIQSYALLTIAVLAGYVPADVGEERADRIKLLLSREPVRQYYEVHYPQLLPSLLRLHVTGVTVLPHDAGVFPWGCFQWFVRFSGRFEKDPNLDTFLGLLDGFSWGRNTVATFLKSLRDPAKVLSCMVKRPSDLSPQDQAVLGMLRFFTFCRELAPALDAMKEAPLTQSACFFYYAYWFNEFKEDVGSHLDSGLSVLEHWLQSSEVAGTEAAREGQRTVDETRSAIMALVDGRFAAPLLKRLHLEAYG